jgi:hypothetical protein
LRVHPGIGDRFAYLLTTRGTLPVRIDASPDSAHSVPKRPDRGHAEESNSDSPQCLHMATSRHLAASAAAS